MTADFFAQLVHEFHLFGPVDLLTVLTLGILEGILSVDNALVLAILVRELPERLRTRALTYGIVGAFLFRFVALVFASHLMRLSIFKLVGGAYLLFLAMKHMFFFFKEDAHQARPKTGSNFLKTVLLVELTDIAFSIDSITTAVAMSDKLLVVWFGGIAGILSLRLLSRFFIRLLDRLPKLEDLAYQLIFFIGTKLTLDALSVEIPLEIFWVMMAVIVVIGSALVYRDYRQKRDRTQYHNRLMQRLEKGEITVEEILSLESVPRDVIRFLRDRGCLRIAIPEEGACSEAGPA